MPGEDLCVLVVAGVTGVKLGVIVRLEGDRKGGSMKECMQIRKYCRENTVSCEEIVDTTVSSDPLR
jgi:hypothetical protein